MVTWSVVSPFVDQALTRRRNTYHHPLTDGAFPAYPIEIAPYLGEAWKTNVELSEWTLDKPGRARSAEDGLLPRPF
ncbi:hypothetical protein Pdw03_1280 [Penicillium digitatum]|uniref:Uncharacterized protein n=1 Tax=Penicillium digitatum TaxID=36651 RepID=A0A7T6XSR5_PENDI|nr:hypothetical protein Pdw03_1280 [Penicillium digitatum]